MACFRLLKDGAKNNQVNQFIIPFAYTNPFKSFNQYIESLCSRSNNYKWSPINIKVNNNELYEHILSLLADDISDLSSKKTNNIGICLALHKDYIDFNELHFTCRGLPKNKKFYFQQINLFLFNTGIGFIVIEANYEELVDINEVIAANHQIKSIKHSKLYKSKLNKGIIDIANINYVDTLDSDCYTVIDYTDHKSVKYIKKDIIPIKEEYLKQMKIINYKKERVLFYEYCQVAEEVYEFKKLILKVLEEVDIITYFNQSFSLSNNSYISNKANIYSTLCIRYQAEKNEDLREAFFRLRKGYNTSYVPDNMEYLDGNKEVFKPFMDSYWGVSREGVANLTYDSSEFMKFGYIERTKIYFYLYLLALHQYYGLLLLAKRISYIPNNIEECSQDDIYRNLISIRNDCNFFYLKCIFDEVSHITHQALYYKQLIDILGIKTMQQEINYEIDRITGILDQVKENENQKLIEQKKLADQEKEKIRLQEKEKHERSNQRTQTILSFVGVIFGAISLASIFDSILSFWINIGNLNNAYKGYEVINTAISFSVLVIVLMTLIVVYFSTKRKKVSKHIDYTDNTNSLKG